MKWFFLMGIVTFLFLLPSQPRKFKTHSILLCIFLAGMAFFFTPNDQLDLMVHIGWVKEIGGLPFEKMVKEEPALILLNFYYWIINKIGIVQLVTVVPCFITYFLCLRLIGKTTYCCGNYKISVGIACLFFLCCFNYLNVVSGIRYLFVCAVYATLLYTDLVERKNRIACIIMYILMVFIHSSAALLMLLRVILLLPDKARIAVAAVLILWRRLLIVGLWLLSPFINIPVVGAINSKIIVYTTWAAQEYANVPLYTAVYFTQLLVIVFLYIVCHKTGRMEVRKLHKFDGYVMLVFALLAGSITTYEIFVRINQFLLILSVPYISILMRNRISLKYFNLKSMCFFLLALESFMFITFFWVGQYNLLAFK